MYKQCKNPDGSISTYIVQRLSDTSFIPFDPDNTDYQVYLRWLEAGNTPTPADEPNNG
jgi:hypothetical protein